MPPPNHNPFVLPPKPEPPKPAEPPQPTVVTPTEPQQPPAGANGSDYGFIMEPPKPPRRKLALPGFSGNSPLILRAGIVLGGLLVLIIILSIARGLLSGGGNTQALTDVAQQQQAMIHILTNGPGTENQQQATLSDNTQKFASTANLTLASAQQQLIDYMTINHKKVSTKALDLKIDPAIDQQLTAAANNSTYDSTFKQVMQTELVNYKKALQAAYQQTSGPKGRKLLTEEFNGANLLLIQLNSPAS